MSNQDTSNPYRRTCRETRYKALWRSDNRHHRHAPKQSIRLHAQELLATVRGRIRLFSLARASLDTPSSVICARPRPVGSGVERKISISCLGLQGLFEK